MSRLSHILVKPGMLRHESYMAMYAYIVTACVMPLYIFMTMKSEDSKKGPTLAENTIEERVGGLCILFILVLIKNFHMERGIMKRFVEDYDAEVHESFPCIGRTAVEVAIVDNQ